MICAGWLKDVQEEHLHVKLGPNALTISEIVAHISYCEAQAILSILLGKLKEQWGIHQKFLPGPSVPNCKL